MFIPFLAVAAVATTFVHLGAMSVQIALLTGALNAMILVAIALAIYVLWIRRKA